MKRWADNWRAFYKSLPDKVHKAVLCISGFLIVFTFTIGISAGAVLIEALTESNAVNWSIVGILSVCLLVAFASVHSALSTIRLLRSD